MAKKRLKKKRWKAEGYQLRCVLCGKTLWEGAEDYYYGRRGAVCRSCLRTGYFLTLPQLPEREAPKKERKSTPEWIMKELDRTISGQEEAKRAVALAIWKQCLRADGETCVPAGHLLLYGPTGCGKTFLATKAAMTVNLPVCVFDSTTLSEAGYRGRDAIDILKDYHELSDGHPNRRWGVVILDEIDKLSGAGSTDRQAYCRGTQHSLLKLLEGIEYEGLNSRELLFILCGAFPGIEGTKQVFCNPIGFERAAEVPKAAEVRPDDFVRFGMERELMGRIPGLAPIHALTAEDMICILTEKEGSSFHVYREFFRSRGIDLILDNENARAIAERALALGTGARALKSELDRLMEPLMFRLAAGELEKEVRIDGTVLSVSQTAGCDLAAD